VRETGRLLDAGVRPAEIARRLKVPESTVYYYRKRLREAVAA
jgi:DNA-binding CsgD family transcriptional regulator